MFDCQLELLLSHTLTLFSLSFYPFIPSHFYSRNQLNVRFSIRSFFHSFVILSVRHSIPSPLSSIRSFIASFFHPFVFLSLPFFISSSFHMSFYLLKLPFIRVPCILYLFICSFACPLMQLTKKPCNSYIIENYSFFFYLKWNRRKGGIKRSAKVSQYIRKQLQNF